MARLKRRGVLRVAFSYAVIAWLVLQIGDVVLDPFEGGEAVMRVVLVIVAVGFPVALALAWFFELTPSGIELDHEEPGAPRPHVTGIRRYADIVIIGVLVIAVAFLLARQGGLIEEEAGEQVLAVLPFKNMSADEEYAYFGDGLADTMIQKLGQLSELVVLASQSTFQFRGEDLDLENVAAKLGATVIMLGSVQRAGNTLRVNARLLDSDSSQQLWAGSYDRGVQDVFAIQDEIARSVTDALHLVLAPDSRERLYTQSTNVLSAYDAYVLGHARIATRSTKAFIEALDLFRDAVREDPGYALAYAGIVEALYLLAFRDQPDLHWQDTRAEAERAAGFAVAVNPKLGEAWLSKALLAMNDRDFLGSSELADGEIIALFEKAVELNPNSAMAHKYFANFFTNSLRVSNERAWELMQAAARLDPRSGIILVNIGNGYEMDGEFALAEEWYRKGLRSQEPYFTSALLSLIQLHWKGTGRLDEAARWARAGGRGGTYESWASVFQQDSLLNLGAWDLARNAAAKLAANGKVIRGSRLERFAVLNQGMSLARIDGEWETVASLGRRMSAEIWETHAAWPVLQDAGYLSESMTALALLDIAEGRAAEALARFQAAYPGPFEAMDDQWNDLLRPVVMLAALHKQVGDRGRAEELLRDYLAFIREIEGDWSVGPPDWTEFTILAMLGETEAALAALERKGDSGYLYQWYKLKDAAFDPDYAAVIADPRFEELYARIAARVDAMRQSYLAEPELPKGYMP